MSKTKQRAGLAVAAYIEDGQGRRVVMAAERNGFLESAVVLATTREELQHAIATLHQMVDDLPGREPLVTPPAQP